MNNPAPEPSSHDVLRPLDHQQTLGESQRLLPTELQQEDVLKDQNHIAINISTSNTRQNNEKSIFLPIEVENLSKQDLEGPIAQQLKVIQEKYANRMIRRAFIFCLAMVLGLWVLKSDWRYSKHFDKMIITFCYAFLSYLLIENIIDFKDQEIILWKKIENQLRVVDTAVLILAILATHLNPNRLMFPMLLVLGLLLTNFFFYIRKSQAPRNTIQSSIITRLSYVIIYSVIIFNISENSSWDLRIFFGFAWPFSIFMVMNCLFAGFLSIYLFCSSLYICFRQNRTQARKRFLGALGCLWVSLWQSNGIHFSVVIVADLSYLQAISDYLILARNINIIFCLFTLVVYKELKESFIVWNNEAAMYRKELKKILYPNGSPVVRTQINLELIRLSSTYFTSNKGNENNQTKQDIVIDTNNEHLCYICFCEVPDAVMARCGHGGICVNCAIAMMQARKRGKCMECRQQVEAILKMDLNSVKGDVVKIVEAIVIKEKSQILNT